MTPNSPAKRLAILRIGVTAGLIAGFALSPRLWLSARYYPLTPVWRWIAPFGYPFDVIVFAALLALLVTVAAIPRRWLWTAAFLLIAVLALQDQSRWQPWFYQYSVMLAAVALARNDKPREALDTCCLIIAAAYIWSGFAKLNPNFAAAVLRGLLTPFVSPAAAAWASAHLAIPVALFETCIGIGLLTRRLRKAAAICAIAMHIFILLALGPFGQNYNRVIWPWNLAMITFLTVLFLWRLHQPSAREILLGRGSFFHKLVLVLFGIMPLFAAFNLWDHYLSSALYSGNRNTGIIYVSDAVFDRLPGEIQDHVYVEGNRNALDIDDWSRGELDVPSYPEVRIYKNVAASLCRYASQPGDLELIIDGKFALRNSRRKLTFTCLGLSPGARKH